MRLIRLTFCSGLVVAVNFLAGAAPESQGFSATRLEALRADLAARGTKAFLVIRNDAIVCEWYAPGSAADKKHGTASLAKAIVGGLSLALAMSDGRLSLDDPAAKFIAPWRNDVRKSRITLRQLGSHTSGIEDAEADGKSHEELTGWKGDFWKRLAVPNDPFTVARDRAPLLFEPGEKMQYSNPGIALMTYAVTAALRNSPHLDIRSLLRERVMRPIGVLDAEWSVGYGQTFTVDGLPLVGSWGGGSYTARATARVGRLMLRGGDWDGRRLLSAEAVRLTTADAGTPGPCGIGWWSNGEGDCARLPRDAFFGSGAGHQILLIVPSLNLIVVRFGGALAKVATDPKSYHEAYNRFLFEPLMDALTNAPVTKFPPASALPSRPQLPDPLVMLDGRSAWRIVCAGGYFAAGFNGTIAHNDIWNRIDAPNRYTFTVRDAGAAAQLRALHHFFAALPFWRMVPVDGLVTGAEALVLAEPGSVYVLYPAQWEVEVRPQR